jgi:hypothetical protein
MPLVLVAFFWGSEVRLHRGVTLESPGPEMAAAMPKESITPRVPSTQKEKDNTKRLVVVLEQASLETVKTKRVRKKQLVATEWVLVALTCFVVMLRRDLNS